MGGHNFMGDKAMPSVRYPSFRTFYAEVLSTKLDKADDFQLVVRALLLLILRAVLLLAYQLVPKPVLWDAFELEHPKNERE